jgi:hypothetical protein
LPKSIKAAWDGTLRRKAAKAVMVVIVFVFIYLAFRFFSWPKWRGGWGKKHNGDMNCFRSEPYGK